MQTFSLAFSLTAITSEPLVLGILHFVNRLIINTHINCTLNVICKSVITNSNDAKLWHYIIIMYYVVILKYIKITAATTIG
jgi:hypothetical protein